MINAVVSGYRSSSLSLAQAVCRDISASLGYSTCRGIEDLIQSCPKKVRGRYVGGPPGCWTFWCLLDFRALGCSAADRHRLRRRNSLLLLLVRPFADPFRRPPGLCIRPPIVRACLLPTLLSFARSDGA